MTKPLTLVEALAQSHRVRDEIIQGLKDEAIREAEQNDILIDGLLEYRPKKRRQVKLRVVKS